MNIRIRNFHLKLTVYKWKKNKSRFKVGDNVQCAFGDSGHKFYPELRDNLIIKKMKYDFYSSSWSLNFGSDYYFRETDFEKVK